VNFPCPNVIDCPCDDSPFENLSAEGVDSRRVPGFFYGCAEPDVIPAVCEAETTELAELCAARECDNYDVFYSQETTCACSTDESITYTVASGSFIALTQESADALAEAFACNVAEIICDGSPVPELFPSTPQTCEVTCNDGTVSYTTIAGMFLGLTQGDADALASQFACDVAALLCAEGRDNPTPTPRSSAFNGTQVCTINCPEGGQFSYAVPGGVFRANNAAQANSMAYSYACAQAMVHRFCLGDDVAKRTCISEAATFNISISGQIPSSRTWSIASGTIPTGMTFANGVLSGTPTAAGSFTFTVKLVGDTGNYATHAYTIVVFSIINTSPIDEAVINMSYVYNFFSSSGDQEMQQWTVISGNLPAGLTLTEAGVLQGTPTESGSFPITVRVLDSTPPYAPLSCMKDFTFTVAANNPCDDPSWPSLLEIHSSSAAAAYNSVTDDLPASATLALTSPGTWATYSLIPPHGLSLQMEVLPVFGVYRCNIFPFIAGYQNTCRYERTGGDTACPFGEYALIYNPNSLAIPSSVSVTL